MSGLVIEPASGSDAASLAGVHSTCFAESWNEAAIASLLASPGVAVLIARNGDKPVGFVMLRIVRDEAEILTIGVTPQHRRQRIAERLMAYAAAQASVAGAKSLFLEVATDNEAAGALYRSLSFREVGTRPRYYRRDDTHIDGLILQLDLNMFA